MQYAGQTHWLPTLFSCEKPLLWPPSYSRSRMFLLSADFGFPASDFNEPMERPAWLDEADKRDRARGRADLGGLGVDHTVRDCMRDVRLLAEKYGTEQETPAWEEHLEALTFLFATLQRILSVPLGGANGWTVACVNASLIHVLCQWCPSLLTSMSRHNLILAIRPETLSHAHNELLVWILSVAGCGRGVDERVRWWAVNQLVDVTEDLKMGSWAAMRSALQQVIWHRQQDEDLHRGLWTEIAIRREL